MKNAIQPIRWRQRRKFIPEFKQDAVRMVLMEGISIKETAEKLGIERSCLNRWKNKHLEPQCFPRNSWGNNWIV